MGNHKNKNNKWNSSHRHVYTKKKNPKPKLYCNREREQATEMEQTEMETEQQLDAELDNMEPDAELVDMELDAEVDTELDIELDTELAAEATEIRIEGCRIINIDKLQQFSDNLAKHSTQCDGSVILKGESRQGLASILTGECSTCSHTIRLETSKKVKGPKGYNRWA